MEQSIKTKESYEKQIIDEASVSNYMSESATKKIILSVLKDFSDIVGHTLGPSGGYNLIMNPYGQSTIFSTKDGFEGMFRIRYAESAANCIRDLLKEVANYMLRAVGDSTTSGYPIIYTLFKELQDLMANDSDFEYVSFAGVVNILEEIQEYFRKNVFTNKESFICDFRSYSDDLKKEFLRRVATISANNDLQIADTIVSVFENKLEPGEEVAVAFEINNEEDDIIEQHSGFELPFGFSDSGFANQNDAISLIFEEPTFLLINGIVNNSDKITIDKVIRGVCDGVFGDTRFKDWNRHPLVIVADSFASDIIAHVLAMKNGIAYQDPVTGTPVLYPVALVATSLLQGAQEKERFIDLATAIGATPVDGIKGKIQFKNIDTQIGFTQHVIPLLGKAKRLDATMYSMKILEGHGDPEKIEARIEYINKAIDSKHANTSYGIDLTPVDILRERSAMLRSKMSRIRIGGINLKEKRRRQTVYDDVLRSVQSTIKSSGFTLAGNVNITWSTYTEERRKPIVEKIAQQIIEKKKNVCPKSLETDSEYNYETYLKIIIDKILFAVHKGFSASYKRSFINAFSKEDVANKLFIKCMEFDKPTNYNLLSGEFKSIDYKDLINSSELLVPSNTDPELMRAVFTVLVDLLTCGGSVTFYPLNMNFKDYMNALKK